MKRGRVMSHIKGAVMDISLAWVDFWPQDKLFGFGLLSFKTENLFRNFLSVYYNDGEIIIDIFWVRIGG